MTKETATGMWVIHAWCIYSILALAGFVGASAIVLNSYHMGRMKSDLREVQAWQTELRESICQRVGHDWEFIKYANRGVFRVGSNGQEWRNELVWCFKCRECGMRSGVSDANHLSDSQRKAIRDKCGVEPEKKPETPEVTLEWEWRKMIESMMTEKEVVDLRGRVEKLEAQEKPEPEATKLTCGDPLKLFEPDADVTINEYTLTCDDWRRMTREEAVSTLTFLNFAISVRSLPRDVITILGERCLPEWLGKPEPPKRAESEFAWPENSVFEGDERGGTLSLSLTDRSRAPSEGRSP